MAYKKPRLVAKSEPKRSFVAGCPSNVRRGNNPIVCRKCELAG